MRDPIRGRGATTNPPNRFEKVFYEADTDASELEASLPRTQVLRDTASSIITRHSDSDVGIEASLNPYRGCEHGCAYCYARAYHEYLGFSAGLDFETKIMAKENAPDLLRHELASRKWKPQTVTLSTVTDPYQPIEHKLQITRCCLQVLTECRNPVCILTKNYLVTRDIDLLQELARFNAVAVLFSIITLDAELARVLEPRTSPPRRRLEAVSALAKAGIPVGVMVSPVIPGLTDHEIIPVVKTAAEAGAGFAACSSVRLPYAVATLFEQWLTQHRPGLKKKVLSRIRSSQAKDIWSAQISDMFRVACRRAGLGEFPVLSVTAFRRPASAQLNLL